MIDGERPSLGLTLRNNKEMDPELYTLAKHNIQQKEDRMFDLKIDDKSINISSTADDLRNARANQKKCLIIFYLLDYEAREEESDSFEPVVGFYLEFPRIENEVQIQYAVRPSVISNDFDDLANETDETDEDS